MAKLIVALDMPTADEATALASRLLPEVHFFKIGLSLFSGAGPDVVRELRELGAAVFLDLKLHDIPAQVEGACRVIGALGVDMVTVHALGGQTMMAAAMKGVKDGAALSGRARPLVVGVTVLTSLDGRDLETIGVSGPVENEVGLLAGLARDAGLDGVVASPMEIRLIRDEVGPGFKIVTPGIRPEPAPRADQKRVMTPAAAIEAGADYLVVGRPITEAPDPKEAALKIIQAARP